MPPIPKVYHNPECSKSRATLQLLKERKQEIKIIEYLQEPPTAEELDRILHQLDKKPIEIIREKEDRFSELGLSLNDNRSREEWIQIMIDNPTLIERPIVVNKDKAALGRPPENVIGIL